jgi:hypothetical protein
MATNRRRQVKPLAPFLLSLFFTSEQNWTRGGKRGWVAKALVLTDLGTERARKTSLPGKGGDEHKRLQASIEEQAGLLGWKAAIEERIPRSFESVDVGLAKKRCVRGMRYRPQRRGHEMQNRRGGPGGWLSKRTQQESNRDFRQKIV